MTSMAAAAAAPAMPASATESSYLDEGFSL